MLAHPELFKLRRPFIASMKELIKRYESAIKQQRSKASVEKTALQRCLLCNPLNTKQSHSTHYDKVIKELFPASRFKNACGNLGCPWIVITGETCDEASKEETDTCYHTTDPIKQRARIDQLKEWIHIYKTYKKEAKDEQKS